MKDKDISVVVPTRNRADEVYRKSRALLKESRVGELIVVIDGSTDETLSLLQSIDDPRVSLVVNETATGPSRARNLGMKHANLPWIALLDDDDHHSEGFLEILVSVAQESKATIVGAPWLHLECGMSPSEGFKSARRGPDGPNQFSPSVIPEATWVETLWLPLNVVIDRSSLGEIRFNEGYRGNYWREETDFFVSVARAGRKVVATNLAYSFQYNKPAGGIDRDKRLIYEFWVAKNDMRFMRRHGRWLQRQGHIKSIYEFLLTSMMRRLRPRVRNLVRKLSLGQPTKV